MAETREGDGDVDAGGALADAAFPARDGEYAPDVGEGGWERGRGEGWRFGGRRARASDASEDAVGEGWETARAAGHGDGEAGSAVGTVGSVRVVWCYNRKVCRSRASYGPSYVSLVPRAPSYLMRVGYRLARWTSARVSAFHRA